MTFCGSPCNGLWLSPQSTNSQVALKTLLCARHLCLTHIADTYLIFNPTKTEFLLFARTSSSTSQKLGQWCEFGYIQTQLPLNTKSLWFTLDTNRTLKEHIVKKSKTVWYQLSTKESEAVPPRKWNQSCFTLAFGCVALLYVLSDFTIQPFHSYSDGALLTPLASLNQLHHLQSNQEQHPSLFGWQSLVPLNLSAPRTPSYLKHWWVQKKRQGKRPCSV